MYCMIFFYLFYISTLTNADDTLLFREPVKKKVWKIPHLGGGGPDRVIFHTFVRRGSDPNCVEFSTLFFDGFPKGLYSV